ncbi:MAG: endolysin [Cyanobium sp.]|jgi:muramidase (phage lysozyme)
MVSVPAIDRPPALSSAGSVLFNPQRSNLVLAALALGFTVAAPAAKATEEAGGWSTALTSSPTAAAATSGSRPGSTLLVAGNARSTDPLPRSGQAPSGAVAMLTPPPVAPRIFAITPERRALLNTIRYAEGTWANGDDIGYRILFGGSLVNSLDRHPDRVIRTARYASAAAGAYQFMPMTWGMVTRSLGLSDFNPDAQDQGALFLIHRRGALPLADQGQLTPQLASLLAPEWASFPTLRGTSYYGQPVRAYHELRRFYERNLAELRQSIPVIEPVAARPAPPACNDDSLECQLNSVSAGELAQ